MEKLKEWYSSKIKKNSEEFDEIDKHIENVLISWEKERNEVLRTYKD